MKKAQKPETAPEELLEENTGSESITETQSEETPTYTIESPGEIVPEENSLNSVEDGDIAGGGPKNPDPKNKSAEQVDEEIISEFKIDINDGAEGNAGQESINDIDVESENVSEKQSFLASAHIKSMNLLDELKHVRDAAISIEKDEDLEVAIVYAEKAVEAIEKLRK